MFWVCRKTTSTAMTVAKSATDEGYHPMSTLTIPATLSAPAAIAEAAQQGGAWRTMRPYLEALSFNG